MEKLYDLIIIGGGTAGLTAAIYAGRAKLRTLVIERMDIGGQIRITSEVVNYPGILVTSGPAISDDMKKQATNFGVEFVSDEVVSVDFTKPIKELRTHVNEVYKAIGIIIATGARPRKLGFEGEAEFAGRGISYCATCDGEFFTDKNVFVIGAGFAAAEEAVFLTRFAKKVTIIAREPEFTCPKTIADKALSHPKIDVHFNTEIVYAKGTFVLKEARFINNVTKKTWDYHVEQGDNNFGIFVFVGYEPLSNVFKGHIELDKMGFIPTNEDMATNVPGVYAAGDIRPKRLKQLVTAAADGAIASTAIEKYIDDTKSEQNIKVEKPEVTTFFDEQSIAQIKYVMERTSHKIAVHALVKEDDVLSNNIKNFLAEFAELTDKVEVKIEKVGENAELQSQITLFPAIAIMDKNGKYTGASFQAVPGGHELESFILAIYNAAGPGQAIEDDLRNRIAKLPKVNLKIGLSLSCTMCPDVVQAAQRISILNDNVTAEAINLQYFPNLRDEFNIMSVPALIVDDNEVLFGKKTLEEVVTYLENVRG
ncbi:MAG: FAD-dependent oxidoreductase [Firmicutes bacterium]|nr:FAD-dependent oxidoreductase [Bacillota bacterium]